MVLTRYQTFLPELFLLNTNVLIEQYKHAVHQEDQADQEYAQSLVQRLSNLSQIPQRPKFQPLNIRLCFCAFLLYF